MAGQYDITCDAGSTLRLSLTYKDNNEEPVDLTGYGARLQVRHHYSDAEALLSLSDGSGITINGNTGVLTIEVSDALTSDLPAGRHVYDLEVFQAPSGDVTRLVEGSFTVTPEVTR